MFWPKPQQKTHAQTGLGVLGENSPSSPLSTLNQCRDRAENLIIFFAFLLARDFYFYFFCIPHYEYIFYIQRPYISLYMRLAEKCKSFRIPHPNPVQPLPGRSTIGSYIYLFIFFSLPHPPVFRMTTGSLSLSSPRKPPGIERALLSRVSLSTMHRTLT